FRSVRKAGEQEFPIDGIGNQWYNLNQLNLWVNYWEKKSCRRMRAVHWGHPDSAPIPNPPVSGKGNCGMPWKTR
ncbi:MAG: hypothetical protein ACI4LH_09910, partial [Candidatus Heritagella sp.]